MSVLSSAQGRSASYVPRIYILVSNPPRTRTSRGCWKCPVVRARLRCPARSSMPTMLQRPGSSSRVSLVFFKSPTALSGPTDAIVIPRTAKAVDWEVELAIMIGDLARNVRPEEATSRIAGLAVANDLTDQGWQFDRGGSGAKRKALILSLLIACGIEGLFSALHRLRRGADSGRMRKRKPEGRAPLFGWN